MNTSRAEEIHVKFFKGAIIVALTFGCFFGAFILLYYGLKQSFFSVPMHLVHAHGHSQVFGWIGLIAMGFAYKAYPRFKATILPQTQLANLSFYFLVTGILLRAVAQSLFRGHYLIFMGLLSALLEFSAVSIFLGLMIRIVARSVKGFEFYDKFIFTAFVSFWLVALFNPVLFYLVSTTSDEKALVNLVATWFFLYRDLQLVAFATMLIFGISQRFIPGYLRNQGVSQSRSRAIYVLLLSGIIGEFFFYLLLRHSFSSLWGVGLEVSFLLMFMAGVMMIRQLGTFSLSFRQDRSLKFFRAAHIWLVAAFSLLVLFPVYNRVTGQPFSHAFFGAYRHALTVGFISMMIMGVTSTVVPTWSGWGSRRLNSLWSAFFLLNIGNIIRVVSQIATEHFSWSYSIMSVSGFVEVAALAFWGVDIWRTLSRHPSSSRTAEKGERILWNTDIS